MSNHDQERSFDVPIIPGHPEKTFVLPMRPMNGSQPDRVSN